MARYLFLPACALLLACGKDTTDTTDTSDSVETRDCSEEVVGEHPLESGEWVFSIDEQLANSCENIHGKGVHIHVGESTRLSLTRDGNCVDGQDADGDGVPIDPGFSDDTMIYTAWSGTTDGDSMTLDGWIEVPIGGTCFLGIRPSLSAQMDSSSSLTYQMDAEIDISQEGTCGGSKMSYVDGKWVCNGGAWTELSDACDGKGR